MSDIFQEFPEETRRSLESAWAQLPEDVRDNISSFVPALPSKQNRWQTLTELARGQLDMAFGSMSQVAIVGPTNVGKSTLYNQLIEPEDDAARTSPVPGTTKVNQSAETNLFTITDTPGMDAVGISGERERDWAEIAANSADFLIILFDAVQGIKQTEQHLFQQLTALGKPYIVALNKIDLVGKKERDAVLATAASNLGIAREQVIAISAKDGDNVERVVMAIVKAEPALTIALGQALPQYRWQLAWRAIITSASSSAAVALTPIPFTDFLPLLGIQTTLVLAIARIYNYKLNWKRARELVAALGAGYAGRTLFYELSKFGGPPAWVLSAAVAGGTTVALGYATVLWFEKGETLSAEARNRILKTITTRLTENLKNIGRRKPKKDALSEQIRQALEDVEGEMGRQGEGEWEK